MTQSSAALHDRVRAILDDPSFDLDDAGNTRDEAIWALRGDYGWEAVRDEALAILEDDGARAHWHTASVLLWYGVDRPMPVDRVIALLYHRLTDLPAPADPGVPLRTGAAVLVDACDRASSDPPPVGAGEALLTNFEEPLDENLVWSITRNLKRVDYLSDYDPFKDPGVEAEWAKLRER